VTRNTVAKSLRQQGGWHSKHKEAARQQQQQQQQQQQAEQHGLAPFAPTTHLIFTENECSYYNNAAILATMVPAVTRRAALQG
jgi:hypothetical protein